MLHYHRTTIDDFLVSQKVTLDVEIKCDFQPAESSIPNYPGCAASVQLEDVTAIRIRSPKFDVVLTNGSDWQPGLNKEAFACVEYYWERFSAEILEHLNGLEEAACESAYESRMERRRELEMAIA